MFSRCSTSSRRGSVSVLAAVVAFVLIAIAGLAIDTAWVMTARQQLQRTADAAALAGAARLTSSGTAQAAARTAAVNTAHANAVVGCCPSGVILDPNPSNDPNGDVVVGRWMVDDATGANVFDPRDPAPNAVQVRARAGAGSLNSSVPLFFGGLFGNSKSEGGRPAIARLAPPDDPLVVVLDPTRSGALSISGSVHLDVGSATVQVDSNAPCAVTSNGAAAQITVSRMRIVGGNCAGNGNVSGSIATGAKYLPDPLASLPEPNTLGMPSLGSINGGGNYQPGYYPGGIDMNNGTATLAPGLYVIGNQAPGNGIRMGGNSFVDATSGVTIFLQNGASYSAAGNSGIRITAPPSGTYQGVGFFQARGNSAAFDVNGNVDFDVDGTVYLPSAPVSLQGNAGRRFGRLLVASLDLGGDATISIDGSLVNPSGPRVPCLVE